MVKWLVLTALVCAGACSQPFVMKPKIVNRPVMVGDIRQIGGEKRPADAQRTVDFSAEIEVLDTPTASSLDSQAAYEDKLDHRLTAATLMGQRDALVSEVKFGSYVFNPVLFYFDKDWIRISGYTEQLLTPEYERVYNLNPRRLSKKFKRGEKEKKEKKKSQKPPRRKRR